VPRLKVVNPSSTPDDNDASPTEPSGAQPSESRLPEAQLPDDAQMVRRAAQRYGTVGAMLAGGMVVFDRLLGRKPKEEPAVVIEAATEPEDIDKGISLRLESADGDELQVFAPPPGRRRARAVRRRRRAPDE
jgi:hypothetical protein